jgi:hypothetical protein
MPFSDPSSTSVTVGNVSSAGASPYAGSMTVVRDVGLFAPWPPWHPPCSPSA